MIKKITVLHATDSNRIACIKLYVFGILVYKHEYRKAKRKIDIESEQPK